MWTQVVGKVRLALSPYMNHWWQVPLYVGARGLTTSAIPCGSGNFEILFDFVAHELRIDKSDGSSRRIPLAPQSVADFYAEVMDTLAALGITVTIWPMPVEIPNPVRFDQDHTNAAYDPRSVERFWRILISVDEIFREFRGAFVGKASPVHFFWGSFDLAVTRFSGRRAPERPGADPITQEAYSHEVISVGFWPGDGTVRNPSFYAYAAPEPAGLKTASIRPTAASYNTTLAEFLLPYDAVREASSPRAALLDFCQSTYEAAADLGQWDRAALERA
jgi:hypothetical protein